jgi:hypothetical protein
MYRVRRGRTYEGYNVRQPGKPSKEFCSNALSKADKLIAAASYLAKLNSLESDSK